MIDRCEEKVMSNDIAVELPMQGKARLEAEYEGHFE